MTGRESSSLIDSIATWVIVALLAVGAWHFLSAPLGPYYTNVDTRTGRWWQVPFGSLSGWNVGGGEARVNVEPRPASEQLRREMTNRAAGDIDDYDYFVHDSARPSSDPRSIVDVALARLSGSDSALAGPSTMLVGDVRSFAFVLAPAGGWGEARSAATRAAPDTAPEYARVRFSDSMLARLAGAGFTITAESPERQLVGTYGTTTWKWSVRADQPGERPLRFELFAVLETGSTSGPLSVRTFERTVNVRIRELRWYEHVSAFSRENWKWFAPSAAAVVGFLWRALAWFRRPDPPRQGDRHKPRPE